MKIKLITALFFLGITLGYLYTLTTTNPTPTGAATCFVNNQPCKCENETCNCGPTTIPAKHCLEQPTLP